MTALVVPSFENIKGFVVEKGLQGLWREELVKHPAVIDFFRQKIDDLRRNLAPHEKIVRFALIPKEFSMEDGEMTPNFETQAKDHPGMLRPAD